MKALSDYTVAELEAESDRHEKALAEAERILTDIRVQLGEVRSEIARRTRPSPEPRCSDHALMRYAERVIGFDLDALRKEIMTENVVSALKAGATAVTVNGVKFVAKDCTLVTVIADTPRPRRIKYHEREDA